MPTRRRFVQGLAGGALLAGAPPAGLLDAYGAAADGTDPLQGARALSPAVSDADVRPTYDLSLEERPVNFTGRWRPASCVNGGTPGPLLHWREGDRVTLRVTNRMPVATSIHWHGVLVPSDMDGVPGLSFDGIAPGSTFVYRFPVMQSGTYWYHSHTHFQEQTGLYGAIVITPRDGERHPAARDYVVMLSDWTDRDPEHVYATLKRDSDYFNRHRRTAGDFLAEARRRGLRATLADRRMWSRMRMDPTDLADVSASTYTYLMNGHTPSANWTALFDAGESVRLRFINASAMSYFDVRIPGLDLTVVAADGQDIEPVTVQEFRIGTAEVYDVLVRPKADRAYTIFAQSMDRSGYARGTLAPHLGLAAEIPSLDAPPLLTMADMGMSLAGMAAMKGTGDMPGMPQMPGMADAAASRAPLARVRYGPGVDMRVAEPWTRLDDPGVGLRHNGRRVLNYADLYTHSGPTDPRAAEREVELHLTGHMQRFMWSFDGRKFSEAEPLRCVAGERLRLVLINDTMMAHPIHLHGMWSELLAPDGSFQARKHTISVQPAQKVSYLVTAIPGRWAYHCHLLYHMQAGMFREVNVSAANSAGNAAGAARARVSQTP